MIVLVGVVTILLTGSLVAWGAYRLLARLAPCRLTPADHELFHATMASLPVVTAAMGEVQRAIINAAPAINQASKAIGDFVRSVERAKIDDAERSRAAIRRRRG